MGSRVLDDHVMRSEAEFLRFGFWVGSSTIGQIILGYLNELYFGLGLVLLRLGLVWVTAKGTVSGGIFSVWGQELELKNEFFF